MRLRFLALPPLLALLLVGCAPRPMDAPAAPEAREVPLEVRWVRRSAEHRAVFLQTYRAAGERLRAMADTLESGTWAVVLDADETLLDNARYQRERADLGLGFTPESWGEWVRREAAPALPGAVAFTQEVRRLGGRVVVVTNRTDAECPPTRANLTRVGVTAAAVLCQTDTGDKNPRFAAVEAGAVPGLAPLHVVMWVGDNIHDFPGLTQDVRLAEDGAFARFGETYWMLPNPMYGSWERNPDPDPAP